MTTFQAFILGLIQGLSEFLPISSSAHLALAPWAFNWPDPGLAFDVFLHLGTLLALLLYFGRDFFMIGKAGIASIVERRLGFERDRWMFWYLILGTIPGGLAGLFFHEMAETTFRSPLLIAVTLSTLGFLLYWIDGKYPSLRQLDDLRFSDALIIGIAQATAIVPGVSRSGSTMTMARLLGMSRESAARFSFLLAFPITFAACVFEARKFSQLAGVAFAWDYLVVGLVTSTVSGVLCIHFLLRYLRSADFRVFAWYRMALALVIILASLILKK